MPLKLACLNKLSFVHSANLISATSVGSSHVIFSFDLDLGGTLKGESVLLMFSNFFSRVFISDSLSPVPARPA